MYSYDRRVAAPKGHPMAPGRKGVSVKVMDPARFKNITGYVVNRGAVGFVKSREYHHGGPNPALLDQLGPGYDPKTMDTSSNYRFILEFPMDALANERDRQGIEMETERQTGKKPSSFTVGYRAKITEAFFISGVLKKK